ncbi:36462_t:CDS:2, partial [Gigaspora margarita]
GFYNKSYWPVGAACSAKSCADYDELVSDGRFEDNQIEQISPNIRESAKISILGPVVAALGKNHWVIFIEVKPEQEFEVAVGHIKFVGFSTTSTNNQNTNKEPEETNNGKQISQVLVIVIVSKTRNQWVLFDFGQYMSHQRFQNIIKYITLTDIIANDDPFYFAQRFYNEFNENLAKAILSGSYLCIDESMCQ